MFTPTEDCPAVLPQIQGLRAAIAKTSVPGATARLLDDFDRLAQVCRRP